MTASNNEFVFRAGGNGLTFVGDFEGLYQEIADPWQQSDSNGLMARYYKESRATLSMLIAEHKVTQALEVGCGLGASTCQLMALSGTDIIGMDISETAIDKARRAHPDQSFLTGDFADPSLTTGLETPKIDAILLNQILWYVMYDLNQVLENCNEILEKNGLVIFSTAFLSKQRYGTDLFNGPKEFIAHLSQICAPFKIDHYQQADGFAGGYIDSHVLLSI